MLKLADLVFRGAEESPPKVTIHIPRAPVVEASPASPSPILGSKPGMKGKRLKIPLPGKAPGVQSPMATPSGKIKIPSLPVQPEAVVSPPVSAAATALPPPPPSPSKPVGPKKEVAFATSKPKSKQKVAPPKKAKPIQGQSGGMSANDYRASRSALKKLQVNKHARLFAQPVDPVRDNAPKSVAMILSNWKFLTLVCTATL
jgi:transcription initiation factor TFIID subunit 2